MASSGEVAVERDGKTYGATYTVSNGMLHVKTHTETRSLDVSGKDPEILARKVVHEIVDAQSKI